MYFIYFTTISAILKVMASSKTRRSSPVLFCSLSKRYTSVFLWIYSCLDVSETLRLFSKKGLVCRLPNQKDTRANALSNTEKGRQRLAQAVVAVEQADKSFFFGSAAENVAFKARLTELLHKNLR